MTGAVLPEDARVLCSGSTRYAKKKIGRRLDDTECIFLQGRGTRHTVEHARLPPSADPAERALWERLRDRRLEGLKFRRQFPVAPFIADFCCFDLKLIVEVDGGVHDTRFQAGHDANRDVYLRSLGYTILRFPNAEIFNNPTAVLHRIATEARRLLESSGNPA